MLSSTARSPSAIRVAKSTPFFIAPVIARVMIAARIAPTKTARMALNRMTATVTEIVWVISRADASLAALESATVSADAFAATSWAAFCSRWMARY